MKIEVINTRYPDGVPNGTIMTVTHKYGNGGFDATVDGGNGFEWFIPADMYRVIPDIKREVSDTPTTGTLAELNVKPGDVVENEFEPHDHYEVRIKDGRRTLWNVEYGYWGVCVEDSTQTYTIISRNSDEPAFDPLEPPAFGELTDAQKVDIMMFEANGGAVEKWFCNEWVEGTPKWRSSHRYRKKPEPKRETVTVTGGHDGVEWCFGEGPVSTDTHRITFNTIDGEPDLDSIKMEKL